MKPKDKKFLCIGAIACLTAIISGAFGAHYIESTFGERSSDIFNTAAEYQMFHGMAIIVVTLLRIQAPHPSLSKAIYFFLAGTICFSGSLYLLAVKTKLGGLTSIIGPITPIGGLLFIIGWSLLLHGILKTKSA